jgi:hypothetical protein
VAWGVTNGPPSTAVAGAALSVGGPHVAQVCQQLALVNMAARMLVRSWKDDWMVLLTDHIFWRVTGSLGLFTLFAPTAT